MREFLEKAFAAMEVDWQDIRNDKDLGREGVASVASWEPLSCILFGRSLVPLQDTSLCAGQVYQADVTSQAY